MIVYLGLSSLLVLAMFRRGQRSSPIAYYSAYCMFFLFGPLVTFLMGGQIYRGTRVSQLDTVAMWYFLAILGLALADLGWGALAPRIERSDAAPAGREVRLVAARAVFHLTSVYAVSQALRIGVAAGSKRAALDAVGSWHYRYLVLGAILAAGFWFFIEIRELRAAYFTSAASYFIYCLAFRERDFIFVVFAILVTGTLLNKIHLRWAPVIAGLLAYFAAQLFILRSGKQFSLDSFLSQGSTLFVDSYLASSSEIFLEPLRSTYMNLVTFSAPTPIGGTGEWFKSLYAPGGISGYGFSLIGEARYNVGLFGVPVVLLAVGLALSAAFTSRFGWDLRLTGPGVMYGLMYALRGDLRSVVVSVIYVGIVHIVMTRRTTQRPGGPPEHVGANALTRRSQP